MTRLLPWPDLTGAKTSDGRICVGVSKRRCRSRFCRTFLRFYDPKSQAETEEAAYKVTWAKADQVTTTALLNGIHALLVQKGEVPFDRGMLTWRVIESRVFLMEVYHGMLWPRYKWWTPYNLHFTEAARNVLYQETVVANQVVGEVDHRPPTSEAPFDNTDRRQARPRIVSDSTFDFAQGIVALRKAA